MDFYHHKYRYQLLDIHFRARYGTKYDFLPVRLRLYIPEVKNDEQKSQSTLLDLAAGEVMIKTTDLPGIDSKFEVKTPTSVVAVQEGAASFSVKVERLD